MPILRAASLDGAEIHLDDAAVAEFRGRLRGQLIVEGDAAYDEARSVWNGMIDRRPALIARCLGAADVVAGVNFARERKLRLSVKGGGHNISGLAVCDGGLTLDMSPMRGVFVDKTARVARAQAGCLLGDVDRETQLHGLAAVLGFVSNTGIAGLTLGGGFGYLTRKHGWTSDNVVAMEMVTADGRVVHASEKKNKDLFWGLRGGGGNFGVITGFDYKLYPLGPEIYAGAMAWRVEEAPGVLALYREVMAKASPDLTLAVVLRNAPPAPWLPADVHGNPIVIVLACHAGTPEAGERELAAFKTIGAPVGDILMRRTYVSQQSLLDATQPKGRRYYWKSEYLPGISGEICDKAVEHAKTAVSPHSAVILFGIAGAIRNLPEDHSAVGNRNAGAVLNIAAAWDAASDDDKNISWARTAWEDMKRFSTGGTYVNFLTEEERDERIRAAYGRNYAQLVEIKTDWDPGNLFRVNKNVAPAGA